MMNNSSTDSIEGDDPVLYIKGGRLCPSRSEELHLIEGSDVPLDPLTEVIDRSVGVGRFNILMTM